MRAWERVIKGVKWLPKCRVTLGSEQPFLCKHIGNFDSSTGDKSRHVEHAQNRKKRTFGSFSSDSKDDPPNVDNIFAM